MSKLTRRALLALCILNVALFSISHIPLKKARAVGTTLTVNSTNDGQDTNAGDGICETATSDECTLRAAIEESNANTGTDTIEFNIPGGGVKTIAPGSIYPELTDTVNIDGYTQPGAQANTAAAPAPMNGTIMIEIDGQGTPGSRNFRILGNNSSIRGLSIYGFSNTGNDSQNANIFVEADDVVIAGNYVGVRADGLTVGPGDNQRGVLCYDPSTTGVEVGGVNPADRNVFFAISSINNSAALTLACNDGFAYGNIIGLAKDGVTDLSPEQADANQLNGPFTVGLQILQSGNQVGGAEAGKVNVVAGNMVNFSINGNGNLIQGNLIGTNYAGEVADSITNGVGISTVTGDWNLIGGVNAGEGNTIGGTKGAGVMVLEYVLQQLNISLPIPRASILGNKIFQVSTFNFAGFGTANLGIDMSKSIDTSDPSDYLPDVVEQRGPNPNDEGDGDTGANTLTNTPVLKTASQSGNQLTITYDLDAAGASGGEYRIEFYANSEASIFGAGPGETYLGAVDNATNGTNKTATLTVSEDMAYKSLSATVTPKDVAADRGGNNDGYGATSEFARNISIGSALDTDADGISDTIEDDAPNNGDTNADSTADRLQPTITAFKTSDDMTWQTVMTTGCSENSSVSSLGPNAITTKDADHSYPFGMTDFTLRCSKGDTANVTIYYFTDQGVDSLHPRKLLANNSSYVDLPGSTLQQVQVAGRNALKLTYSITDGSEFDDDRELNGLIHDPVGLATNTPQSTLPTVGVMYALLPIALTVLVTLIYAYYDYRRHKHPLVAENPHIHYTFWHHLKVVTLPIMRYRLSIVIDHRDSTTPIAAT